MLAFGIFFCLSLHYLKYIKHRKTFLFKAAYSCYITYLCYSDFMSIDSNIDSFFPHYINKPFQSTNTLFIVQSVNNLLNFITDVNRVEDTIHHCLTFLMLNVFAFICNEIHLANFIIALHNTSDIFVSIGKHIFLTNNPNASLHVATYFCLIASWMYDRLYRYGYLLLILKKHRDNDFFRFTLFVGNLLYLLHIFWFIKILNVGFKKFVKKKH
jgi:hypothetical protein